MENIALLLNMFVHILAVISYSGGLLYSLILMEKRRKIASAFVTDVDGYLERFFMRQPLLWMGFLVVIILTGFNFAVISLAFHGKPPDVAPIAFDALITMVVLTIISFGLVNLLWGKTLPALKQLLRKGYPSSEELAKLGDLRNDRRTAVQHLLILALIIIFCAVTLRFMA